jgi:ATP-dependent helicase HrpB
VRGPRDADAQLVRRIAFADLSLDLAALVRRAAAAAASTASTLDALDPAAQLTWDEARELERRAPESLRVPSGRSARLDYEEDGGVSASVKLQELFGLADTPRVGARQAPVLLKLLAPNGRPVQTTRDLRSFWDRTYPEVRKELRGRYPRHPWPDDPWSATPTARTTRRQPGGNP